MRIVLRSLPMHYLIFCLTLFFTLLTGLSLQASVDKTSDDPVIATVVEDNSSLTRLNLELQQIEFQKVELDDGVFDYADIGTDQTISREGYPDLPFIARSILIPPQSDVRLEINNVSYRIENGLNPVIAPRLEGEEYIHIGEAKEYQAQEGFWPPQVIEIGKPALLRGYRLINLRYYPVQYNRSTGETKLNENVDFSVVYEGIGENIVENPDRNVSSIWAYRAVRELVDNPPEPPARDDLNCASYLYIIPDDDDVLDAIAPLLEWRNRQGHRVAIELVDHPSANTIDNMIDDYYDSDYPVDFVSIVGDPSAGNIRVAASNAWGDYEYSIVVGDDELPDVAVGRISITSIAELERVVAKILGYEMEPEMEDTDWFLQGAVVAGSSINGMGTVFVAKYVKQELEKIGFTEVRDWYHNVDGNIGGNQPFLSECFDWGISVMHYRAYHRMNGLNINVLYDLPNRRGPWPPVLAISCNTGTFVAEDSYSEAFFKSRGGGIGAIGTATPGTHPQYNNIMAGGVWKAIYKDELYAFGWGLNGGKYGLWRAYDGFNATYINFMNWNNLIGDPGSIIWTGIPRIMEVDYPEALAEGESRVTVDVINEETGEPVEDAIVCLYKPDDDIHIVHYTNGEGVAEFFVDPTEVSEGQMHITVTKHNHLSYLGEIDITSAETFLGLSGYEIDDDDEGESAGNDDGDANPSETIELTLAYYNYGQNAINGEGEISLESLSPWAEVISDPVVLEHCPDAGEESDFSGLLQIHPACPNQTIIPLAATITFGDESWRSMIELSVSAPEIEVEAIVFAEGELNPGDVQRLDVVLHNSGLQDLGAFTARVESVNALLRAIEPETRYNPIRANQSGRNRFPGFRLSAHPFTIPGVTVPLMLIIETASGFIDTTSFDVTIGEKEESDPLGPDSYGYICLDSNDEGWEYAPEYDWIEIDPGENNHDFRGTELNLPDNADNRDVSVAIDLPFEFQYYGEVFDEITICSNGWAAFGDQSELGDFRNRQIGQALGPNAQLCAWWDNLVIDQGAILYHYDDDNGKLIIEWNNVARLLDGGGRGAHETFEIVLYDPEVYQTLTGDGMILFQYKDVTNENRPAHNDTPFCTIGISNLDDSDGIQYTYWNAYPAGASAIGDEMALLFMTQSDFRTGILEGTVTDFETSDPIAGAQIVTSRSFWAETDDNGHYIIDNILVDEGYSVTASELGWNDSTIAEVDILEDESTERNFQLLHPEFTPSDGQFNARLADGEEQEIDFTVFNTGNGPLTYSTHRELVGDANADPWELRESLNISAIAHGDNRIQGVVFVNDMYYVSGAAGDASPKIYIIDREGNLQGEYDQPGASRYGFRDLAWDGEWIWGSGDRDIYAFTPEGETMRVFDGPWDPNSCIVWDSTREILWVAATTSNTIVGIDRNGNEVDRLDRLGMRLYGLSYYPEDADDYNIYILHREVGIADQIVTKMNPVTGDTLLVKIIDPNIDGNPAASFISNQFDVYSWVMMNVINDGGADRVDIWQLGARKDWFGVEPAMGTLDCGGQQDFTLTINATGLPEVVFEGILVFDHNAALGETRLSVTLDVVAGAGRPDERILALESGWSMISLNIIPDELEIIPLMQPLVDEGVLNIIKDGQGRFYSPENDFNNIPGWASSKGYQINLSEAFEFTVEGVSIAADEPIPLSDGWNMAAYYPHAPLDAMVALENIVDVLEIAKDGYGQFYLPEFGFSNMGDMSEGNGYQLKVTGNVELVYNFGDMVAVAPDAVQQPSHYLAPTPTDGNMSVLLKLDKAWAGAEVAAIDPSGVVIGAGVVDALGNCGLAVWCDDPATQIIDGAQETAPLQFVIWNGLEELPADSESLLGEANWTLDGVYVGRLQVANALPLSYGLSAAYPNPFNGMTRLTYSVPEAADVSVSVYDVHGRLVKNLVSVQVEAGTYAVAWDSATSAAGVYIIRMEAGAYVQSQKVMLLK